MVPTPMPVPTEEQQKVSNVIQEGLVVPIVYTETLSPIHHLANSADNLVQIGFATGTEPTLNPTMEPTEYCDMPHGVEACHTVGAQLEPDEVRVQTYSPARSAGDSSKVEYTSICFGDGEEEEISTL